MRTSHNLAVVSLPLWGAAVGANSARLFQEIIPPDAVAIIVIGLVIIGLVIIGLVIIGLVIIGLVIIGLNAWLLWSPGPRRKSSTPPSAPHQ